MRINLKIRQLIRLVSRLNLSKQYLIYFPIFLFISFSIAFNNQDFKIFSTSYLDWLILNSVSIKNEMELSCNLLHLHLGGWSSAASKQEFPLFRRVQQLLSPCSFSIWPSSLYWIASCCRRKGCSSLGYVNVNLHIQISNAAIVTGIADTCIKSSNTTILPNYETKIGTYNTVTLNAIDSVLWQLHAVGIKAIISPHDANLLPPNGSNVGYNGIDIYGKALSRCDQRFF